MYSKHCEIKRKLDQLIECCRSIFVVTSYRSDDCGSGTNVSTEEHEYINKLQPMCMRLKRWDFTYQFVPRPIKYENAEMSWSNNEFQLSSVSFDRVSSFMTSLRTASLFFKSDSRINDLSKLHRPLCHRCTSNWLFWTNGDLSITI